MLHLQVQVCEARERAPFSLHAYFYDAYTLNLRLYTIHLMYITVHARNSISNVKHAVAPCTHAYNYTPLYIPTFWVIRIQYIAWFWRILYKEDFITSDIFLWL
jgi:hypothetical protein